ncbi:MAG: 3-isopropylmalate/(R)-2-methylmalate dehydratase large subunit [Gammaproteobacteria bacterium]|jgi:3-isopropylmalate/(R)-2-methylmalate dehydratase large subunit|nr:3-isopropylmalate/(R)-2-methylmalate dehydratase large subunit [Gammaproteobacteria bacterium]
MNMVEKILAKKSGKSVVEPGEVVVAGVDLMVMHDLSASFVIKVFENEMEGATIKDPARIVFAFDHNFAPATREAAEALASVRRFAARHKVPNLFDCGCGSIHHAIMEAGLASPGMIITGCDSHTPIYGALGAFATGVGNNSMAALGFVHGSGWLKVPETIRIHFHGSTMDGVAPRDISQYLVGYLGEDGAIYKALEYAGPYIEKLDVADRALFPLQAIDVGGKCGFVNPDQKTADYVKALLGHGNFELLRNDPEGRYAQTIDIDVSKIEPQIACPPTVGNVKPIDAAAGTPINVAEIGGSTGGRLSDIRTLAKHFANKKVAPGVRLQVVPASRGIYLAALREGLFETLHVAGANIFPPSCGSNQAFNMGALAEEEVMISTQARNFPGRNGHPKARHFLASPLTVAASALSGRIADPRTLL